MNSQEFTKYLRVNAVKSQWFFFHQEVNGKAVEIKMFPGKIETDLQIFKIDGFHQTRNNYQSLSKTIDKIVKTLYPFK